MIDHKTSKTPGQEEGRVNSERAGGPEKEQL
jgi:hypothetical protein